MALTTKNLPKVAIIMASYNGDRFIAEQIQSILNQQDVTLDLYISDNNSQDKTQQIISEFKRSNPNIYTFVNRETTGAANNFYYLFKKINLKKYDFIALADQDDIWPGHKISRAIAQLINHQCQGYASDFLYFHENQNFKYYKKSYVQTKFDYLFETPGPGCTFVLTSSLGVLFKDFLISQKINFPFHDWLIYAFARSQNFKWLIDDSPNLFYRQHDRNEAGVNNGFYAVIRRLNRILLGRWWSQIYALTQILQIDDFKKWSQRQIFFYLLRHFFTTRRNRLHALFMVPFLFLIGMQKK